MISDRIRKRHLAVAFAFALAVVAAPLAQPFDSAQGKSAQNPPPTADLPLADFGEHGMVFNGLLFWNDIPAATPSKPTTTAP